MLDPPPPPEHPSSAPQVQRPPPQPHWSPDGKHLWDGQQWVPAYGSHITQDARGRIGRMNLIQRLILVVGIAGVIAAVALALLPLPSVTEFGATISSCGPGLSSESALGVKLNPDSVNEGSGAQTPAQAQAFVNYCQGLANDRLVVVAVIGGASILGALVGIWVMGIPRHQSRAR